MNVYSVVGYVQFKKSNAFAVARMQIANTEIEAINQVKSAYNPLSDHRFKLTAVEQL